MFLQLFLFHMHPFRLFCFTLKKLVQFWIQLYTFPIWDDHHRTYHEQLDCQMWYKYQLCNSKNHIEVRFKKVRTLSIFWYHLFYFILLYFIYLFIYLFTFFGYKYFASTSSMFPRIRKRYEKILIQNSV